MDGLPGIAPCVVGECYRQIKTNIGRDARHDLALDLRPAGVVLPNSIVPIGATRLNGVHGLVHCVTQRQCDFGIRHLRRGKRQDFALQRAAKGDRRQAKCVEPLQHVAFVGCGDKRDLPHKDYPKTRQLLQDRSAGTRLVLSSVLILPACSECQLNRAHLSCIVFMSPRLCRPDSCRRGSFAH